MGEAANLLSNSITKTAGLSTGRDLVRGCTALNQFLQVRLRARAQAGTWLEAAL